MKISRKFIVIFAVACVGLFGNAVYASGDVPTTATNVKADTVKKEDKMIEMLVSEDEYVRITQPTKVNTFTFESKMNIAGETKQGTDIVIEVYNTKLDKDNIPLPQDAVVYKMNTVGVTETFNQLIDLAEGKNTVVLIYSNDKDKKNNEKMVFFITRESEQTKEKLKSTIIIPQLNK